MGRYSFMKMKFLVPFVPIWPTIFFHTNTIIFCFCSGSVGMVETTFPLFCFFYFTFSFFKTKIWIYPTNPTILFYENKVFSPYWPREKCVYKSGIVWINVQRYLRTQRLPWDFRPEDSKRNTKRSSSQVSTQSQTIHQKIRR